MLCKPEYVLILVSVKRALRQLKLIKALFMKILLLRFSYFLELFAIEIQTEFDVIKLSCLPSTLDTTWDILVPVCYISLGIVSTWDIILNLRSILLHVRYLIW